MRCTPWGQPFIPFGFWGLRVCAAVDLGHEVTCLRIKHYHAKDGRRQEHETRG